MLRDKLLTLVLCVCLFATFSGCTQSVKADNKVRHFYQGQFVKIKLNGYRGQITAGGAGMYHVDESYYVRYYTDFKGYVEAVFADFELESEK